MTTVFRNFVSQISETFEMKKFWVYGVQNSGKKILLFRVFRSEAYTKCPTLNIGTYYLEPGILQNLAPLGTQTCTLSLTNN